MTRSWLILLLAALLLPSRITAAAATPADESALREIVTLYEQAVRNGELPKSGIRKNLAPGFTAVLPTGQAIQNYAELAKAENALRTLVGRGAKYQTIEVTVTAPVEVSNELAALSGQTHSQATAQGGQSRSFTTHWSAVAKKDDNTWRLLRHQAVMDQTANPWHQNEPTSHGWTAALVTGLLGGLAGLIVGALAVRRLSHRFNPPAATPPTKPAAAPERSWQTEHPAPADPTESAATESAATEAPAAAPPTRPGRKRAWED